MENMSSLRAAQCMIILSLVLLIYQHPAIGKNGMNDIPQTKEACPAKQERIQFFEFRPEHSAEEYELPPETGDDFTFGLEFCTRSKMAFIAVFKNKTAKQELSIQTVDGFLSLSVEEFENERPECVWTFSDEPVNNGILHTVKLKISPKLLSIELYKMYKLIWSPSSLKYNSCLSNETLSTLYRLVLGGEIIERDGDSKIQVLYGFAGCMKNTRLNGRPIQNVGKLLISEDVTPGCPEFDVSCTQICPPTAKYENGVCICPEGTEMDSDGTCSPSCSCPLCQNGGTCYTSSTEAHCACPSMFSGNRCEVILSPCDGVLCNNGSCIIDHNSTSFQCICHKGYKGKFCNKKDKCFPNPCHNGGTCQEIPDDFICLCPPGISGNVCDERLSTSEDKDNTLLYSVTGGAATFIIFILIISISVYMWKRGKCRSCSTTEEDEVGGTNPAVTVNNERISHNSPSTENSAIFEVNNDTVNNERISHNNPSTRNSTSFEQNETDVTCRTEQSAHLDDSAGNIVMNIDLAVPVVNYSKNENHISWFTSLKNTVNKTGAKTENMTSSLRSYIFSKINEKFASSKIESSSVINEGNSDQKEGERSHCVNTDEGDFHKEDAKESHSVKSQEGDSDEENAEEFNCVKSDEGNSDKEEAEESRNVKTDEGRSDKEEPEESHNMKTDEGNSDKEEAEKSRNVKTDEGRSDKEEPEESHNMKTDEGNSDKEEA